MKAHVWNPELIELYSRPIELVECREQTSKNILEYEKTTYSGSISSWIEVNDEAQLKQFITATHNETNIELHYFIYP